MSCDCSVAVLTDEFQWPQECLVKHGKVAWLDRRGEWPSPGPQLLFPVETR